MQRYADWYRDNEGRGYPGGVVTVYDAGLSTLPQLYSANGDISSPPAISNPFTTDANGFFAFAVPNGVYDIHLQGGGMPETIIPNVTISEVFSSLGTFANPMTTAGDTLYGGSAGAPTRLAGNTTTTPKYLRSVGNGVTANAPSFTQIPASEVANTPAGNITQTNSQAALNELDTLSLHKAGSEVITGTKTFSAQPAGITAASIVNVPAGTIAATDTQAAINEIVSDLAATTGARLVGFDKTVSYASGTVGYPVAGLVNGTQFMGPTNQRVFQANAYSYGPFISRAWCTTGDMSIFIDPASGNDANPGTQAQPLATVEAACQLIPQNIYHKIRIYMLDGDYSGQTIQLFGYYVTASSKAGLKIIGHVASVDGEAHPIYGSDNLDAVTIDGAHVVSGVHGTEELTLAGIKFVDSWVEAYASYLYLYKCKFDGGYSVVGFDSKICMGGHNATIYAYSCDYQNCAAAVDAEGFLTVFFDTCTIGGMVDSPYYPGTYGCPIKANNGGLAFVKASPQFWTAGYGGKKNVCVNGGRIHGQNPFSEGVGGVNYINRVDGAQAESVHIDGGAGTAAGQGSGGGFTAYGKNVSGVTKGMALIEFGTNAACLARVQHIPASLTPTICVDWDANGSTIPYGYMHKTVGANVASATTISPTAQVFHVTGTTAIATINLPVTGFKGTICLIPDGIFTTTTAGNIGLASTAVVGKALHMTYDGTKWYPSY